MAQPGSSPESTLREEPISLVTCLVPSSRSGVKISSRMLCTRYSFIRFPHLAGKTKSKEANHSYNPAFSEATRKERISTKQLRSRGFVVLDTNTPVGA